MPFPEIKRVIYKKNPLDQVICQLRFPTILKIDAEIPADFQDRIRKDFPNFKETPLWKVEGPPDVKGIIPLNILKQILPFSSNKNYEFSSENGEWEVNLTRTFIALTANKYERWEKFRKKLERPLKALNDIYSPAYYSRIGLRYIDVIRRLALKLEKTNWNELIQPHILGILSSSAVRDNVQNLQSQYEIRLSDGKSMVQIITKLVEPADGSEVCYRIDSDFFKTGKTNISDAMDKLKYFNIRASRLIQWCITEKLHNALEPQTL